MARSGAEDLLIWIQWVMRLTVVKKWREAADAEEPKDVLDLVLLDDLALLDDLVLIADPGATTKPLHLLNYFSEIFKF
jgi:hypothetical protein